MGYTLKDNMEIKIRRSHPYKEAKIIDGLASIETGFLNAQEQMDLAKVFIEAAYDLLYNVEPEAAEELADILNDL